MLILRALVSALFSSFGPFTLGMGAFIVTTVYFPATVRMIQRWAQGIENMMDFDALPDRAAVLANLIIDDTSITILVFVVGAKFIVALVTELLSPRAPAHPEQRSNEPSASV